MANYELVLLLDSRTKESERKSFLNEFEKNFKDNIITKDEIGAMSLLYPLKGIKENDVAYFCSYYLQLDAANIKEMKQLFLYNNIILKYDVFRRTKNQSSFEFKKLQEDMENIIGSWEEKKLGQKISFFSDLKNAKYIDWKAVPMLKKYVTRFGDIKPRKYTHNSVSIQKKLRKEIIRARGFGLIEFIK